MTNGPSPLSITDVLPTLHSVLAEGVSAVLQAPPGAGKTTGVPPSLLHAPWLGDRRIVMLEPRRLAARAAARRMAANRGEQIGETVGFRVRGETRIGPRTRIEVVTEGILTRMVLADPALEDVAIVVFDEFHERSVHADLGLALTLHSRDVLREDLRVLVMSATLDGSAVAELLGGAPVVTSPGIAFPVETRHLPPRSGTRLEAGAAAAVRMALSDTVGDILVFLPGAGEIRRTEALLSDVAGADVLALHGNLPAEAQDRALRPSAPGRRKVVLATSIAETSLTIDGVRVVVDAGWSRVPRYAPRTGMSRLATVRVSLASADQRRGRAGRQAPGVCFRLWSEHQHRSLVPGTRPEILEADLAPLALDLAAAGVLDPNELAWLDPPPDAAFSQARSLLGQLGAVDSEGRISTHGRAMSRLALHPRLAHMVLKGLDLGDGGSACDLAALLSERDVLGRSDGVPEADIRTRLDVLRGRTERVAVDRDALRRVRAEAQSCRASPALRRARGAGEVSPGVLLALAYPDRIAQERPGSRGRYLLRNGLGATLDPQSLTGERYLAVAAVEGREREGRILVAAPITLEELEDLFAPELVAEDEVGWDESGGMVTARRRTRLGAIVLRDAPLREADSELVTAALIAGIKVEGLGVLPWSPAARGIQSRTAFVRRLEPGWPDLSDDALLGRLQEWLGPWLGGMRRRADLGRVDLEAALEALLGRERQLMLEMYAPTHVTVPSGSRLPIDYGDPAAPFLAVRLQEVFGWEETPRLGGGRVPLTLHLLSPASRPVQVTRDLAGFWRGTYFEVRRDLKGRYPRHYWPDDPLVAEPTRRARPRGKPGNPG